MANINESNLSKTPPWPARSVPLSFIPASLFNNDSKKSPNWPKNPVIIPKSGEYYSEIDKRIRVAFPQKFGNNSAQETTKPVQNVASAKRSNRGASRKTVKLTSSQVAIAKKLGVPLEEYAKHLNVKE